MLTITGSSFFPEDKYACMFFAKQGFSFSALLMAVENNEAFCPESKARIYKIKCDFPLPYEPVKILALSVDLLSVLARTSSIICKDPTEGI